MTSSTTDQSTEETAARGVVEAIGKAWADNNPDGFADAYTEDATMILSGDRFFRGREVIRKMVRQQFASAHKGTTLLQTVVDLRFLSQDTAVIVTEGGVLVPGETAPSAEREIRATWVLAKQPDQKWSIAAYQNSRNADNPLPGA